MKIKAIAKTELPPKQREELVGALKARIEKNLGRHPGLVWAKVHARLEAKPDKLGSLSGGDRACEGVQWYRLPDEAPPEAGSLVL
jgi:hypothetical protein